MQIVGLDFETFFSDDYTLKKMTTESYIRDPRFEAHGASIKFPNCATYWYDDLPSVFRQIDWSQSALVCHHAHFDGLILSHHYGVRPAFWFDTLSMGRLLLGNHLSVSLESLARHFQLAPKNVPYNLFKGKHWPELDRETQATVADGCCHDVDLMLDIFSRLQQSFPQEEYAVVDATVRMFTEPALIGDLDMLGKVWSDEQKRKADALSVLGITADQLQSAEIFAELLRACGVEPGTKDGKHGPIYAFAKSDDFMRELLDSEDETVQALAEARIGVKSTGTQTRSERLGYMATRGAMPVYIGYCGAHTTRDVGGDKVNWQNFRRDDPKDMKPTIRRAIKAPPGFLIIKADASQIECRMLNFIAGQHDVIEKFAAKRDLYSELATAFYGFPVSKETPKERGTGKQLELSCGYGAGALTIQVTAKKGTYGPPVFLTIEEAERAKHLYRDTHTAVVDYWRQADWMLRRLYEGAELTWGPLHIEGMRIYLPNGAPLIYDTLEWFTETSDDPRVVTPSGSQYWRLRTRKGWAKMYGAKLVENVIQALARVHVFQAMLRIRAQGLRLVNREHDALAFLVSDDGNAERWLEFMLTEMRRAPEWLPGIPLDAEGTVCDRYERYAP